MKAVHLRIQSLMYSCRGMMSTFSDAYVTAHEHSNVRVDNEEGAIYVPSDQHYGRRESFCFTRGIEVFDIERQIYSNF